MDAVILAAGRGSRVEGLAPPFFKPMMVVNGRPLISSAIHEAEKAEVTRIIIVAAPENAAALSHHLDPADRTLHMVVQLRPTGPGDGLLLGLKLVNSAEVLVLMSDNVFSPSDIPNVLKEWRATTSEGCSAVVGVRHLDDPTAFTRLKRDRWVEKVEKGPDDFVHGRSRCWVGPLIAKTTALNSALEREPLRRKPKSAIGERAIGPALNHLQVCTADVQTYDIGALEAWTP